LWGGHRAVGVSEPPCYVLQGAAGVCGIIDPDPARVRFYCYDLDGTRVNRRDDRRVYWSAGRYRSGFLQSGHRVSAPEKMPRVADTHELQMKCPLSQVLPSDTGLFLPQESQIRSAIVCPLSVSVLHSVCRSSTR